MDAGSFGARVENTWKCPWLGEGQGAGRLGGQGGPWACLCLERSASPARTAAGWWVPSGRSVGWVLVLESPRLAPEFLPAGGLESSWLSLRQPSALGSQFPRMPPAELSSAELWLCPCRPCLLPVPGTLRGGRSPVPPIRPSPSLPLLWLQRWPPVLLPSRPANPFCCHCHPLDLSLLAAPLRPSPALSSSRVCPSRS